MNPAYRFGEKIAMRRGVKEMKKLYDAVEAGTAEHPYRNLDQIATYAPKVLGDRAFAGMGPALGSGGEGVAYPVLSPEGASVLKIHDPTAPAFHPDIIEAKRQFIGHNIPNVAKIHGEVPLPGRVGGEQVPAFLQEYIPGRDFSRAHSEEALKGQGWELNQKAKAVKNRLKDLSHKGHGVVDAGEHNMRVQPNGSVSVFDFIGVPDDQLSPVGHRATGGHFSENLVGGGSAPLMTRLRDRIRRWAPEDVLSWEAGTHPDEPYKYRSLRDYSGRLAGKAFGVPGSAAPDVAAAPAAGSNGAVAGLRRSAVGLGLGVLGTAGALYGAHKLYKRWQDKPADEAGAH